MTTFKNLFDKEKPKVWLYFIVNAFFLVLVIGDAMDGMKNGIPLQVHTKAPAYSSAKTFNLPNNNQFHFGTDGQLNWHPANFTEALLINTAKARGGVNISDALLLYVTIAIFYFMMAGSGKKNIFSANLTYGFMLVFFLIAMSGVVKDLEHFLVKEHIKSMTNGQFILQDVNNSGLLYTTWGSMLFFMLRFPKQVLDMQKEQELTI